MTGRTSLLIGTTKGAFLLHGDDSRSAWRLAGPFCDLWPINHVVGDSETGALWAAGGSAWHGAGVWHSADRGESWTLARLAGGESEAFVSENPEVAAQLGMAAPEPAPFTGAFDSVWSLCRAHGRVYAGTRPAALYVSDDDGVSWEKLTGLTDHPSAAEWEPGGAGLTLHTIVAHPDEPGKLWVGISAAGVFATEDGGQSWERRIRRSNAGAAPDLNHPAGGSDTEVGMCVHNMVRAPGAEGDLLYQQNHHGVLRSTDGGRSWEDITPGLPSRFGFPVAVHPRDPDMAWVFPLNGDSLGRYPTDAAAAIWRTSDGGGSWARMDQGLPSEGCFFTVLRQAMSNDTSDPCGLYFGTNSGSVFASRDAGESWSEIARHLPTVLSVEALTRQ